MTALCATMAATMLLVAQYAAAHGLTGGALVALAAGIGWGIAWCRLI